MTAKIQITPETPQKRQEDSRDRRTDKGTHSGTEIHDRHRSAATFRRQRSHDGSDWYETCERRAVGHACQHYQRLVGAKMMWQVKEPQRRQRATARPGKCDCPAPADLIAHPAPEQIGNHVGREHDPQNLKPLL